MPPRSFWNGALSISGVTIPVKVFAATERHNPRFELTREDQDRVAALSHQRAAAAQEAGVFEAEIVPVA